MHADTLPLAGLADPVHDAQRAFRAALAALSRPGLAVDICGAAGPTFDPASAAATSILLALSDESTPVWWPGVPRRSAAALRFHSGASVIDDPAAAAFVLIGRGLDLPDWDCFSTGSDEFPERAAMLIVDVPGFGSGAAMQWQGPGIDGQVSVRIDGLPRDFVVRWSHNHGRFPCGVDLIFTCGHRAIGLPRSVRVA